MPSNTGNAMSMCTSVVTHLTPSCKFQNDAASRPTHPHVAFGVDDLKTLFHRLGLLAGTFAFLLRARRFYDGDWCGRSRRFGTSIVKVSFTCTSS